MNNPIDNNKYKLDSTYIIRCHGEQSRTKRGTCFSISEKTVITAWHVVENMSNYSCFLSTDDIAENKSLTLKLIEKDENLDIAILEVINHSFNNYIEINDIACHQGIAINSCGFPQEKGTKHCTLDTDISENYESILTDNISFEVDQSGNVSNYKGMSGSPILVNGKAIGVLLVQQGGTSLYCISFSDIKKNNTSILKQFIISREHNKPQDVLFYRYTIKNENFYLERSEDIKFNKSLLLNNVWLSGKSGSGKTALLNRNLLLNDIKYCYVDFSAVTISSHLDVLSEIFYSICERFEIDESPQTKNLIKDIAGTIKKSKVKRIVIVIDELSIDSDVLLKDVANSLMNLINHITNCYGEDTLKFSVSTISPPSYLLTNASKAQDFFYFLDCSSWNTDLEQLFELLCDNLQLDVSIAKEIIIEKSGNSPRVLKSIFKEIVLLDQISLDNINKSIDKVLGEVVAHD